MLCNDTSHTWTRHAKKVWEWAISMIAEKMLDSRPAPSAAETWQLCVDTLWDAPQGCSQCERALAQCFDSVTLAVDEKWPNTIGYDRIKKVLAQAGDDSAVSGNGKDE